MGKRRKKKRDKAYRQKQAFYNQLFANDETKPGEIRQIALQVFGSIYFTSSELAPDAEKV
jgi:hypothetical protein